MGNFFRTRNGKVIGVLVLLVLLAAIPMTLFVGQQSQDIRQRASGTCSIDPVDVILVIDTSNSMAGGKLGEAKTGARTFTNIVTADTRNRIGIATFDNNGGLNRALTSNRDAVITTINGLTTPGDGRGGTCLECAIDKRGDGDVMSGFAQAGFNGNKRHVIILTDGRINRYMKDDGTIAGDTSAGEEQKARDQALGAVNRVRSNHSAIISAIQYGGDSNRGWLSTQIVNAPGKFLAESTSGSLDTMYRTLANQLVGGTVIAHVFDDLNKNGVEDAGEPPLANVPVTIRDGLSTAPGAQTEQTVADASGESESQSIATRVNNALVKQVYAACNDNRDCNGTGRPYCVQHACVECRNPGSSNDCNNPNNVCNANHHCVPKTPTPTQVPPPTAVPPTTVPTTPPTGGGDGLTKLTDAAGNATFTSQCAGAHNLTVTPLAGYEGSTPLVKNIASVPEGGTVGQTFGLKRLPDQTVAICNPSTINWKENSPLEVMLKSSTGTPLASKAITWSTTSNHITLTPTSAQTNASGVTQTSVGVNPAAPAFDGEVEARFGGDGTNTAASCKLGVHYEPPAPEVTLVADPTTVTVGESSILRWTTKNVTSCEASQGWNGSKSATGGSEDTGPLFVNTGFTITCTGPGGPVSASTSIDVEQVPVTVSPPPGGTVLNFSLLMHGMGAAGDNVVPQPAPCKRTNGVLANPNACLSNQNPLHPERDITVEIYNQNNELQTTSTGKINYDNASGTFKGSVDVGADLENGIYNIKVVSPMFLKRQIPGFHTLTASQPYTVPQSNLISSDVDNDNKLTILDYNMVISCYTFVGDPATCAEDEAALVDTNDDGDNDEFDENLFRRDLIVQYGQ